MRFKMETGSSKCSKTCVRTMLSYFVGNVTFSNNEFTNIEQLSYIFPDDNHKLHEFNIQSKDYKLIPDFAFNRYLWECELEFN